MSDSVTPRTVAHQAPLSFRFFRQEFWSGLHLRSHENTDLQAVGLGQELRLHFLQSSRQGPLNTLGTACGCQLFLYPTSFLWIKGLPGEKSSPVCPGMVSESPVRAGTMSVCSSLYIRVTGSSGHRLQLQKQVNEVTGSKK